MNRGTCIHFSGLSMGRDYKTNCCSAGVNYYDTFDGTKVGMFLRMPCVESREKAADGSPGTAFKPGEATVLVPVNRGDHQVIPCPHFKLPTDDQVQQARKESEESWEKTIAAIRIASEWRVKPKPEDDRSEVVECPVCHGQLHLSQSSHNGHVHGQCETTGCVSWME